MNKTVSYYNTHATQYAADTVSADMRPARNLFLELLPRTAAILDLGCGSGRDAKAFLDAGYSVEAVDGSAKLCKIASAYTGIAVRQR